ncbi:MAG: type IV secretory system conjugative DNA transfer family protein [Alphaproteobacteria bacterium]
MRKPEHSHPVPYRTELSTRLIKVGKSYLTLRDLFIGSLILGCTGSGKSSSVLYYLLYAMLYGVSAGGIILTSKASDLQDYLKIIRDANRIDDVMVMDETAEVRFNLLRFCAATMARNGFVYNLVALIMQLSSALRVAKGENGNDTSNAFFKEAMEKWLHHALAILVVAKPNFQFRDLYEFIISTPQSEEQVRSAEYQNESACWASLAILDQAAKRGNAEAERVLQDHADFFLKETARLGEKTRSSIIASITNVISPLLSGVFYDLFCRDTNWVPQMAREGKILIVNLPTLKFGPLGAAIQSVLKTQFGQALQADEVDDSTRPAVIVMDEYQNYINGESDSDLLATARSSRLVVIMATQDLSTLKGKIGNDDMAESIINKTGLKFLLANTSVPTNEWAAKLIGKTKKNNSSVTTSRGQNVGGGLNQSENSGATSGGEGRSQSVVHSVSEYETYRIMPSYFSHGLKTGGSRDKTVEMIVVANGKTFPETGEHWLKTTWSQR